MFVWRKLASAKWEDAWVERLRAFGPERLAITTLPNARTVRLEIYGVSKKEAAELTRQFGGQTRKQKIPAAYEAKPPEPIRIRQQLVIVSSESARAESARQFPKRKVLLIPAAMAFGTGAHATTAQCLRFLCDAADELGGETWEMLDLGTGSGILAVAARALGARRAEAADFDRHATRTARVNARLNHVTSLGVRRFDVTKWSPPRQWEIVCANLFSEVLIASAPQIARAVTPRGRLYLSGILRTQERETIAAFRRLNLRLEKTVSRGKWVTLAWSAPA